MAVTLKPSGTTAVWGVKTSNGDTFASAKILSQKVSKSADQEPLPNSDGEVVGLAIYNQKQELEVEVIVESGTTNPTVGGDIQIAGQQCICTAVDEVWDHKGWKKLSVKAVKYETMSS